MSGIKKLLFGLKLESIVRSSICKILRLYNRETDSIKFPWSHALHRWLWKNRVGRWVATTCFARPKGTAQIWFGPLPPCALDTWHDMMVFLKSWWVAKLVSVMKWWSVGWKHSIPHWKCAWIMMTHCSCSPFLYPLGNFDLCVCVCVFCLWFMDLWMFAWYLLIMLIHLPDFA